MTSFFYNQLIDMTGASVTNKGIYYEHGKEPPAEGPPKLHLLIESNEEFRVRQTYCTFMNFADLFIAGRTSCQRN